MLQVTSKIQIPIQEFDFAFSRSGGPGGQNVNKVNSKVTLAWHVARSPSIDQGVKDRLYEQFHRRINKEGQLLISSQRFRDQGRNVADCLEKLRELLLLVAQPPTPRKATKPSRGARERRLQDKRQQASKKQQRGGWSAGD